MSEETAEKVPFEEEPRGYRWGEDGDGVSVTVTSATRTAQEAHAFAIEHAEDVLDFDATDHVLRPERLHPTGMHLQLDMEMPCDEIPLGIPPSLRPLLAEGKAEAWWTFSDSGVCSLDPRWIDEADDRMRARTAEERRRARAQRGPWWWRLRVRAANAAIELGAKLRPADERSTSWIDENNRLVIATYRARKS